jgi:TRAP-type C4-dicarboxylate transport system permease small subunit
MFGRLLQGLNAVGTAWIFVLMLLVCTDIVSRFVFSAPIRGVAEIAGFSVVAITFLQLPSAVRGRRLARADLLIQRLHLASPRLAAAMEVGFALMGAAVFAAILWAAVTGFLHAWETADRFGAQQVFTFPKWPIWLLVLVGSACVVVAFLVQAWADATARRPASRTPARRD